MTPILIWAAALYSTVYGALSALAGLGQTRMNKIQAWAAWGLVLFGLVVITAALLTILRSGAALPVLVVGLLGMHALAINNGFKRVFLKSKFTTDKHG